jgi:inner membrane protein
MDSVTHVALGAVIGEATGSRQLKKQALGWGAFAQFFPDFDILASLWLPPAQNLIVHRGITHSIPFSVVAIAALSYMAARWYRRDDVKFRFWVKFFSIQISVHLFIDAFNAYGVGLLEPFSQQKFSFHIAYVLDPLFLCWVLAGAVALLFVRSERRRRIIVIASLALSFSYLGLATVNKFVVTGNVKERLAYHQIASSNVLITPTPMNSLLWFVAAEDESGFHVGHASVFDVTNREQFTYFPKNDHLLSQASEERTVRYLKTFAEGYYTVETWTDTLVFNDLRFGQMAGWVNPDNRFVFHYYVNLPDATNKLVMQRGRVSAWNERTVRSMFRRIGTER